MQITDDARSGLGWLRQTLAGCVGALPVLPVVLTLGLLAFAPLGAAAPQLGLFAAFVTAAVGSAVHTGISRAALPAAGPSSATALTLAALVTQLLADPRLATATGPDVAGIAALCGAAVLLSGTFQIGFALLGMARLTRVVPQPVLAGFMNSTALLVVLYQLPLLLDLPPGARPELHNLGAAHPLALTLGLGTAGCIWLLAHRWPRLPAALLGLLAGTAVHAGCMALAGNLPWGARVGTLALMWPWPPTLLPLWGPAGMALLQSHALPLLATALALATLGAMESSLNTRAIDQFLNTRHEPRRELIALGCGNMVCGLLGGVPLVATRTRVLATLQAGGRGRLAAQVGAATLAALYLVGGPVLAALPLPVLAGVMLTVALGLADRWTGRLLVRWWRGDHSRDLLLGLGLVAMVFGTTLWQGMAAGVGLGVLLSLVTFAMRMNRSLLHDRFVASARPSRRLYPAPVEARLRVLREAIVVFEVEGPLFFGSGDRLMDEADTLPAHCRCLVLDLRRVGAIDESGAVALQTTAARAARRGIRVELAGLAPGSAPARALDSFAPALPHWPDADRAIESAEQHLLGDANVRDMAEVPLAATQLMLGLDAEQVATVATHLQRSELQPGEILFAEGEGADRLYVVTMGSVSVLSTPDKNGLVQRYLSVSPGMVLGETAMLDGGGRTAGAVADAPTVVHALTLQALDELGRSHTGLAMQLYRNLALHLSQRLRGASAAWRASAR